MGRNVESNYVFGVLICLPKFASVLIFTLFYLWGRVGRSGRFAKKWEGVGWERCQKILKNEKKHNKGEGFVSVILSFFVRWVSGWQIWILANMKRIRIRANTKYEYVYFYTKNDRCVGKMTRWCAIFNWGLWVCWIFENIET